MPSFFSQGPIDYGARYIAQAGDNIAGQLSQYSAQQAQLKAQQDRMAQQAAIEEQARQTELQRQIQSQAATYGVQPIVDPTTQKFDPYATQAAVAKAKNLQELVQRKAGLTMENDFNVGNEMAARGLKQQPAPGPIGADSPAVSEQDAATASIDPRQQIYNYDRKAKQDDYEAQRKATTDAELARQRAAGDAKELDAFRSAFGREPAGNEIDPATGRLSATGLGAIQTARVNSIKGFVADPSNPSALIPIPGGPADMKMQADKAKADAAKAGEMAKEQALTDSRANVLSNIDAALPQIGRDTAGVMGAKLSGFYQPAQDLHANLDAIKSGLGVDTLNQMRASSANGSTGIGRIMQVEFDAFSKAARNLDQSQSPDQLRSNLTALKDHLQKWTDAHNAAIGGSVAQPGSPNVDKPSGTPPQPGAIKIRSIKQVSP